MSECAIVATQLATDQLATDYVICVNGFLTLLFICNIVTRWFIKGWALLQSRTRFGVCWDYIRLLLFAWRCGRVKNYDTV